MTDSWKKGGEECGLLFLLAPAIHYFYISEEETGSSSFFLLSSEGSDMDGEEVDTKQEVRGGGGEGGSEADSWLGSPCIWQDPTGGARGGLIVIRAGKAVIHQNDAPVEGGFKANSANILRIAVATHKLLPLCFSC